MKFSLSLLVFLFFTMGAVASHIAGGEVRLKHLSGTQYKFELILYFNSEHGAPEAMDPTLTATVFRASDDQKMTALILPLIEQNELSHPDSYCVSTLMELIYSANIDLADYDDPEGYYLAWERCCRSYEYVNILSEDPQFGTGYAGQTFFIHFPPVIKDGSPFNNSSPVFERPTTDVVCLGSRYTVDFSATDADGDSLVYSLTTPLSTHSADPLPGPIAKPYPLVQWRNGYSMNNMMNGNPDLTMDASGTLSVMPTTEGLYAFAVMCEEYRDGNRIGEVRREFQFLVMSCMPDAGPVIEGRTASGEFTHDQVSIVLSGLTDAERCVQIRVQDDIKHENKEVIGLKAIPIGSNVDISQSVLVTPYVVLTSELPSPIVSICLDRCALNPLTEFTIGVVAYDICNMALSDTARFVISMERDGGCEKQSIEFPEIQNKVFGDAPFVMNATASSGLPITYSSSDPATASVSGNTLTMHKPGQITITATQSGNESYQSASPVEREFCINPPKPVLSVVADGDTYLLTSDQEFEHLWFIDGANLVTYHENAILWTNVESGEYTVRSFVGECVSEISDPLIITGESGEEIVSEFYAVPNPTQGVVALYYPIQVRIKSIELLSGTGQRVMASAPLAGPAQLDISVLPSGMYFIKFVGERKSHAIKLIKN
jgi:hypothetical protein